MCNTIFIECIWRGILANGQHNSIIANVLWFAQVCSYVFFQGAAINGNHLLQENEVLLKAILNINCQLKTINFQKETTVYLYVVPNNWPSSF